jgi:hypothetical protein
MRSEPSPLHRGDAGHLGHSAAPVRTFVLAKVTKSERPLSGDFYRYCASWVVKNHFFGGKFFMVFRMNLSTFS